MAFSSSPTAALDRVELDAHRRYGFLNRLFKNFDPPSAQVKDAVRNILAQAKRRADDVTRNLDRREKLVGALRIMKQFGSLRDANVAAEVQKIDQSLLATVVDLLTGPSPISHWRDLSSRAAPVPDCSANVGANVGLDLTRDLTRDLSQLATTNLSLDCPNSNTYWEQLMQDLNTFAATAATTATAAQPSLDPGLDLDTSSLDMCKFDFGPPKLDSCSNTDMSQLDTTNFSLDCPNSDTNWEQLMQNFENTFVATAGAAGAAGAGAAALQQSADSDLDLETSPLDISDFDFDFDFGLPDPDSGSDADMSQLDTSDVNVDVLYKELGIDSQLNMSSLNFDCSDTDMDWEQTMQDINNTFPATPQTFSQRAETIAVVSDAPAQSSLQQRDTAAVVPSPSTRKKQVTTAAPFSTPRTQRGRVSKNKHIVTRVRRSPRLAGK